MNVYQHITDCIGNTPMVRLNRIVPGGAADVFVKLEMYNPSRSVKDRAAYNMIATAEAEGLIKPGDTIIEPTSGNTGIGLAMNAAADQSAQGIRSRSRAHAERAADAGGDRQSVGAAKRDSRKLHSPSI